MKPLAALFLLAAPLAGLAGTPVPTVLKGAGLKVSVDLQGFEQVSGLQNLHGSYYSLGQYSSTDSLTKDLGDRLILSVLVDDIPEGATLPKLVQSAVMERLPESFFDLEPSEQSVFRLEVERIAKPEGVLFSYTTSEQGLGDAARALVKSAKAATGLKENEAELRQMNIYFESLKEGKWVEVHFSALFAQTKGDKEKDLAFLKAAAKRVISSLQVQKL